MYNSPKLLFPTKKQLPSAYLTPCFETTLYKLRKSTFKEKHDCWTKTFVTRKFKKNSKFYNKIINKCDMINLTRKNINICVYTTLEDLHEFSLNLHPSYLSRRLRALLYRVQ